jgi:hypothetical protein
MFQFCWSLARAQRSRAQHVGDDGPSVLLQLGGVPAPVSRGLHRRDIHVVNTNLIRSAPGSGIDPPGLNKNKKCS